MRGGPLDGSGPGAIVIGSDYRGLGVVRSLGRRGLPVVLLRADDDHGSAWASRYCTTSLRWPASEQGREEVLADLRARTQPGRWAIFPTGDEAAAHVARDHARLGAHFLLTTPPDEVFRWAYDKRLTYQLADCVGVDHPRTTAIDGPADVAAYDGPFPALLKPACKPRLDRFARDKGWVVADASELRRRYEDAVALGDGDILMVQELVPATGGQVSFAALWRDGEPVASVCARRTRQQPIDIGRSSSFVETIDDPELEGRSRRLARALRLTGLAEIEFVRDGTGRCALLDLNARIWGWHTISRGAGLDFPWLTWLQCTGEDVPVVRAPPGDRWMRLVTDLPAAGQSLVHGRTTLRAYLASVLGRHERAVLAGDDPVPALLEVPAYVWSKRPQPGRTDQPVERLPVRSA